MLAGEAVDGGRLSLLKSVYMDDYLVKPEGEMPSAAVVFDEGVISGNSNKVEASLSFTIYAYSIRPDRNDSLREISLIAWDEATGGGILPVILDNPGFLIDGRLYRLEAGAWRIRRGVDSSQRFVFALEIPIVVKTWKRLQP